MMIPGRSCPLSYRYEPRVFARAPDLAADTLYIVGGLYGNAQALDVVREMHASEPGARLVFNGDFNWFNAERASFVAVNRAVLACTATRGNVETEIAAKSEQAGCGCAYPDWVSDADVARSNEIMARLKAVAGAEPGLVESLAALPMHLVADVGGVRVAIIHGDLESLAGWDLAQERAGNDAWSARVVQQMARAQARIVASSHTCLPFIHPLSVAGKAGAIINNGAAGMPNFKGTRYGVMTRVSVSPSRRVAPLYCVRVGVVYVEALPIHYDYALFVQAFERCWAPQSPAYRSYYRRIVDGPDYRMERALR